MIERAEIYRIRLGIRQADLLLSKIGEDRLKLAVRLSELKTLSRQLSGKSLTHRVQSVRRPPPGMMEGFGHAHPAGTYRDNSNLLYCDRLKSVPDRLFP
jgi:hypothetical protein